MLVSEKRPSGLLVARDSMSEASVGHALRGVAGGFWALQKRRRHEHDPHDVTEVYKVVHVESGEIVFTWMDDFGNPLPLSSGLIEAFQKHLRSGESEDDWNQRLLDEKRRDADRDAENIADDHRPYIERGRLPVSMSDAKQPRYWKRKR